MTEHELLTAVAFPDAQPGAVLRFRTADMLALRTLVEREEWVTEVQRRLGLIDPAFITSCLKLGLKQADGRSALGLDWSDLAFPPHAAVLPLTDALMRAVYGRRYIELQAEPAKADEA